MARRVSTNGVRRGVVHPQRRVRSIFLGVMMVFSLFAAQLVRLQGLESASLSEAAFDGRVQTVTIPAARGTITDVNGVAMAESVERKHVTADPVAVATYKKKVDGTVQTVGIAGAAADIAAVTGGDPATLAQTMQTTLGKKNNHFTYLVKDISPQVWQRVEALGIPGIYSEPYLKRSYPLGSAPAPLLGYVGAGDQAAGGIEQIYDKTLTGTPGTLSYERGGLGERISTGTTEEVPAVPGQDVRLTIDSDLEWYAYNAIKARVEETGADSGYVIVTDPRSNQILAMVSYPSFDPSKPLTSPDQLRNAAVEDAYEPGSTGKLITAAAALELGLVTPETPIVLPFRVHRGGTAFKDAHDPENPYVTFAGALATSSNMGTIMYGEAIPDDVLNQWQKKFGLGRTTGLGLPGESPGLLPAPKTWSATTKSTMLFGQGLTSSALQQVGVFQAVANDGVQVPPSIVAGVTDAQGRYTALAPKEGERVITSETASTLTDIMEYVPTAEGTAPLAEVPGYRVAGKTSTASRVDPKTNKYKGVTAAFIGFAPADDPQILVSVTIQRPRKISQWGGTIAGPVFSDVMRYALTKRGIAPSTTLPPFVPLTFDPDAQAPGEDPGVTLGDVAIKEEGTG